jgi:hypothetical protein
VLEGNALTQGIGVATGLQNKFDWKGVAVAAVSAGINQAVGQALGGDLLPADQAGPVRPAAFAEFGAVGDIARNSIAGFASGVAGAAVRGGKISIGRIAADAFGNALGSSITNGLQMASSQQEKLNQIQEQQSEKQRESNRFASGAQANAAFASGANGLAERFAAIDRIGASGVDFTANMGAANARALRTDMGMNASDLDDGGFLVADSDRENALGILASRHKSPMSFFNPDKTTLGGWVGDVGATAYRGIKDGIETLNNLLNPKVDEPLATQQEQVATKTLPKLDRIDELIQEAKVNRGLPFTGTLDANEKAELYTRMYRESASPEAITAFDNGEKVIFGMRNETPWNANSGRGVFDDRVVVLQKTDKGNAMHYEGAYNTEPAGSYDEASPNFGVSRTSSGPGSTQDVNGDGMKDAGRLRGGETYIYKWSSTKPSYGPAIYGNNNVLRSTESIRVERDVEHNGTYSYSADPKVTAYDSGQTFLFHRGYNNFTGSAGCQTFPVGGFANFAATIAPTPAQNRFFYTLKNM